ncbi:hypothetical protein C0581_00280 [Candidatus Parcubacteria bacterium]|nr:MAG: hypothetical protein C0581_00280 [Candidatus Parcubacteria bacterium]
MLRDELCKRVREIIVEFISTRIEVDDPSIMEGVSIARRMQVEICMKVFVDLPESAFALRAPSNDMISVDAFVDAIVDQIMEIQEMISKE